MIIRDYFDECFTMEAFLQALYSEAYSEPCQTCKMERFAKIFNGFYPLTNFAKRFILDVW